MTGSNLHLAWARYFLRSLVSSGVTDIVLSPGSRSTPLALAAAAETGLVTHVVIDERVAGFFALGQARLTGRPSVLVCTSGSAGAHYLPAVIEASLGHVPLLAVTADRPWEAQDCASPQTIDQTALLGVYVRHRAELGLPDGSPEALRAVARIAAQAVYRTTSPDPGPVHINARFRKPLEPVDVLTPEPWEPMLATLIARGAPRVYPPTRVPPADAVEALTVACLGARRGLIACGPAPAVGDLAATRAGVFALAHATGFPLFAETTSQVRFCPAVDGVTACSGLDTALWDRALWADNAPDLVIELGAPLTSATWTRYLSTHPTVPRWVVSPFGWNDPMGDATAMVFADPGALCAAVADTLHARRPIPPASPWTMGLAAADAQTWSIVRAETDGPTLTEGVIAARVVAALPSGGVLCVGNSMPVRDLDTYAPAGGPALRVIHQRGASGIDGLVAGAAGARSVSDAPVVVLLGDVSFQHDLGGLAVAQSVQAPFVIVVVQNHGGRIFQQLPLADRPEVREVIERLFVTPQRLDIPHAAGMFRVGYARVDTVDGLQKSLSTALATVGCTVIEAIVPPTDATQRRAALRHALTRVHP